tara:strand:- start:8 stop:724 length:717 start_codon:yes stop_codon:yes gene_type:complete
MQKIKKSIVVVFCYNVEENIFKIIKKIKKLQLNKNFDFLFLDDKSKDSTLNILKKNNLKNCKVIENKINQGFGLNYKYSIKYAKKNNYKYIIFLHGDNQYPAEKISSIEKNLKNSSLCFGSRRLNKSSMIKNMPLIRYIANVILTYLINLVFNNNASEYFSGFRGINLKYVKKINLDEYSNNWVIEQQIHFSFIKKKYRISEIPINTKYEKNQVSMIPPFTYVLSVVKSVILFSLFKF